MKIIVFLLIMALMVGIIPVYAQSSESTTGELVATYGEGKLYKYGDLFVVELHGNYREMGRQYGALRKDILNYMNDEITLNPNWLNLPEVMRTNTSQKQESNEFPNPWLKSYYEKFPNYNEIMLGIGETSGLGDRTYLICSPLKEIYIMSTEPLCSFVAAWGPYTPDSQLIAGRNFDWSQRMANYNEIVVYNPTDGTIPVATMGYAGSIYLESGLNKEGLFIELNEGSYSENILKKKNFTVYKQNKPKSTAAQLELFNLAQTSANTEQLDKNFANVSTPLGVIINAADKKGAYSYESISNRYVKRNPQEVGLLVATNHFIDPSWNLSPIEAKSPDDYYYTVLRMNNLLNLSQQNKGNITPEIMMQMISTPTEEGGALMPETAFEMVVVPNDLKVWFRAPQYLNWTEVNLKNHFS